MDARTHAALYYARKRNRARRAVIATTDTPTVAKTDPNGTVALTLRMVPQHGRTVYTLDADAAGAFALSGNDIVTAAGLAAVAVSPQTITVTAVDPSRNTFTRDIDIVVTGV